MVGKKQKTNGIAIRGGGGVQCRSRKPFSLGLAARTKKQRKQPFFSLGLAIHHQWFLVCKMLKVITIVFSQCTFDRLCIDWLVCTSRIKSESKGNKWTFTYPSIRINTYSGNKFKYLLPTYNFWASLTSFSEHSSIRISFAMNLWGSLKNISHYHWNTALCLFLLP